MIEHHEEGLKGSIEKSLTYYNYTHTHNYSLYTNTFMQITFKCLCCTWGMILVRMEFQCKFSI